MRYGRLIITVVRWGIFYLLFFAVIVPLTIYVARMSRKGIKPDRLSKDVDKMFIRPIANVSGLKR